ncbi:MAG: hypothetical protein QM755_08895 [Luteolibacter sp.]
MLCPFCRSPLDPGAPECPACRVTFPRTSALLGVLPRLSTGISDGSHRLTPAETAKLLKAKDVLERKFPQVTLQVVIYSFPQEHPFGLHVFWVFNAASFAGDAHRGVENHTILLAIDPDRAEGALMVGYGLESFVSREALDHLLELAGPAWQLQRWLDGIMTVVNGLDPLLESVAVLEDASAGEF